MSAAEEQIEETRQQNVRAGAAVQRQIMAKTQRIVAAHDGRIKQMTEHGSFSYRSKDDQSRLADTRKNTEAVALQREKSMRAAANAYKNEKEAISERVALRPNLSVRPQVEADSTEPSLVPQQHEEEPKLSKAELARQTERLFKAEQAALSARLRKRPNQTFWSKAQLEEMQQHRQVVEANLAKGRAREEDVTALVHSWNVELDAMDRRIAGLPALTFRRPEEMESLKAGLPDPEALKEELRVRMDYRAKSYKEEKDAMIERLNAKPKQSFRTAEEIRQWEEGRTPALDPASRSEQLRELSRTYNIKRRAMLERAAANVGRGFEDPEEKQRRHYAESLRSLKVKPNTSRTR